MLNRPVTIEFGPHKFETIIQRVDLAKLGEMVNKPDMRVGDNGVSYTPPVAAIHCSDGVLCFILDDIQQITQTISGVKINMGSAEVTITCR